MTKDNVIVIINIGLNTSEWGHWFIGCKVQCSPILNIFWFEFFLLFHDQSQRVSMVRQRSQSWMWTELDGVIIYKVINGGFSTYSGLNVSSFLCYHAQYTVCKMAGLHLAELYKILHWVRLAKLPEPREIPCHLIIIMQFRGSKWEQPQ